jgi:hypothetical protein
MYCTAMHSTVAYHVVPISVPQRSAKELRQDVASDFGGDVAIDLARIARCRGIVVFISKVILALWPEISINLPRLFFGNGRVVSVAFRVRHRR